MQDPPRVGEYRTVKACGEYSFIEQKSRFAGRCFPVKSEAEAEGILVGLRKRYWDATHNCHAFRLGTTGAHARSSDDGEPSGTAGVPILSVLARADVTDALIVVTRYFGGVLLGAGGLVRAYSRAAAGSLKEAGVVLMRACALYELDAPYPLWPALERTLRRDAVVREVLYLDTVRVRFAAPLPAAAALEKQLTEQTLGKLKPTQCGTAYLPFPAAPEDELWKE